MTAMPEARSMFSGAEIGRLDGDGMNMFLDGWGKPICWLRWAPGYTNSSIQVADAAGHHDPMDYANVYPGDYQLFPLIYAGVNGVTGGFDDYGISPGQNVLPTTTPITSNSGVGIANGASSVQFSNHNMDAK